MRRLQSAAAFAVSLSLASAVMTVPAVASSVREAGCRKVSVGEICARALKKPGGYKVWVELTASKVVRNAQLGYYNKPKDKYYYENYKADMSTGDVRSVVWNNLETGKVAGCVLHGRNRTRVCGWA